MTKIFTDSIFYDYNYILSGQGTFQSRNIVRLQSVLTLEFLTEENSLESFVASSLVIGVSWKVAMLGRDRRYGGVGGVG